LIRTAFVGNSLKLTVSITDGKFIPSPNGGTFTGSNISHHGVLIPILKNILKLVLAPKLYSLIYTFPAFTASA